MSHWSDLTHAAGDLDNEGKMAAAVCLLIMLVVAAIIVVAVVLTFLFSHVSILVGWVAVAGLLYQAVTRLWRKVNS